MDLLANMDLRPIGISLVTLIVGAAFGWFVARSRFTTRIAELNTNLVLERRVNKQLCETLNDAVPSLIHAPNLTMSVERAPEPTAVSG